MLTSMNFTKIEGDFKYLVKMPMDSVTEENVREIMNEKDRTEEELRVLNATTVEKMWFDELDVLEKGYDKYKVEREKIQAASADMDTKKKRAIVKKK